MVRKVPAGDKFIKGKVVVLVLVVLLFYSYFPSAFVAVLTL